MPSSITQFNNINLRPKVDLDIKVGQKVLVKKNNKLFFTGLCIAIKNKQIGSSAVFIAKQAKCFITHTIPTQNGIYSFEGLPSFFKHKKAKLYYVLSSKLTELNNFL